MVNTPSRPAVGRFYSRISTLYDVFASSPLFDGLRSEAVSAMDLDRGDRVLELGCGTGGNIPHLESALGSGGTYVGIDVAQGMLARAQTRGADPTVHLLQGDATSPPVVGPFDAILVTFVSGILDDPEEAVEGWLSLLTDEGRLVLLDAAGRRGGNTPLEWGFRTFVYLAAPPSTRTRYDRSPNEVLIDRVETAREALTQTGKPSMKTTRWRGFVRLTAAGPP